MVLIFKKKSRIKIDLTLIKISKNMNIKQVLGFFGV